MKLVQPNDYFRVVRAIGSRPEDITDPSDTKLQALRTKLLTVLDGNSSLVEAVVRGMLGSQGRPLSEVEEAAVLWWARVCSGLFALREGLAEYLQQYKRHIRIRFRAWAHLTESPHRHRGGGGGTRYASPSRKLSPLSQPSRSPDPREVVAAPTSKESSADPADPSTKSPHSPDDSAQGALALQLSPVHYDSVPTSAAETPVANQVVAMELFVDVTDPNAEADSSGDDESPMAVEAVDALSISGQESSAAPQHEPDQLPPDVFRTTLGGADLSDFQESLRAASANRQRRASLSSMPDRSSAPGIGDSVPLAYSTEDSGASEAGQGAQSGYQALFANLPEEDMLRSTQLPMDRAAAARDALCCE